ncbi:MAG: hypothetical protein IT338_20200 [Thermomicrobiales bacterium]|nr:hypothetical protein [Thermomicrobiales bacterium]
MDGERFDRLARLVGERSTRRRLAEAFVALGLFAAGEAGETSAGKKHKHGKKPRKCKAGKAKCGGACVDTTTDGRNCGKCGNACGAGKACVGGACQGGGCSDGQRLCNGACVDTQTDTRHCGACDAPCDRGRCVGGECIECANQDDCGGYDYNNLVCKSGRCVCAKADEGICTRYLDGRGSCHVCCPGGSGQCLRDEVCQVSETPSGLSAVCTCPTGWQRCTYLPAGTCVADPMRDPHKCGQFCKDCDASDPGAICCQGSCTRGCSPGYRGSGCMQSDPCGSDCQPCGSGTICCNQGPGTEPSCIPDTHGGFCYLNT